MSAPEQRSEGMSRRQLLRHTAWFGAVVVLTATGGGVISHLGGTPTPAAVAADPRALRFVQVSDSHIGFAGPANTDVTGSFSRAIDQVNGLGFRPDFVMHTGDLTHLSTPDQFDQVRQMMRALRTGQVFTVPGEHDSVDDHGQKYRAMFGAGTHGDGWYSLDIKGVHVIALVNTLALESSATSGSISSTSSARTSPGCPAIRPSWCSAISRCSRCTRPGVGAPMTRFRR